MEMVDIARTILLIRRGAWFNAHIFGLIMSSSVEHLISYLLLPEDIFRQRTKALWDERLLKNPIESVETISRTVLAISKAVMPSWCVLTYNLSH